MYDVYGNNVFKIGFTKCSLKKRISNLNTGFLNPCIIIFSLYVKNVRFVEKLIHEKFNNCRLKQNREFSNAN